MVTRKFSALLIMALLSLGLAACGGGGGKEATLPEDPRGMAEVAGFQGVHNGELEIRLRINRHKAGRQEGIEMHAAGSFTGGGAGHLPEFSVGIESHGLNAGHEIDFNSAISFSKNQLGFTYGPTYGEGTFRADTATFKKLKAELEAALQEGGAADAGACLKAAGDFNAAQVLRDVSYEGASEALGGVKVKSVSADLDLPLAFEELVRLTEDPACGAQLEAFGVPPASQLEQLEEQLKSSATHVRVTLSVDRHGVIHDLNGLTKVKLPHDEELEIEFVFGLNRINEGTELLLAEGQAPLALLLKKFGVSMQMLEQADGNEVFLSLLGAIGSGLFGHDPP